MAATIDNGQTCLEKRGMTERHEEITRSDYNIENQYGPSHQDALATGDARGKGVGGQHGHFLPDCTKPTGQIDYSNFTTSPDVLIGDSYDNDGRGDIPGRKVQMARSLYSYLEPYNANLVDTTLNQEDGQYVMK